MTLARRLSRGRCRPARRAPLPRLTNPTVHSKCRIREAQRSDCVRTSFDGSEIVPPSRLSGPSAAGSAKRSKRVIWSVRKPNSARRPRGSTGPVLGTSSTATPPRGRSRVCRARSASQSRAHRNSVRACAPPRRSSSFSVRCAPLACALKWELEQRPFKTLRLLQPKACPIQGRRTRRVGHRIPALPRRCAGSPNCPPRPECAPRS